MRKFYFFIIILLCVSFACKKEATAPEAAGRLDAAAIYSDGSALYVNPKEPASNEAVVIKLRTKKDNVSEVILHLTGSQIAMVKLSGAAHSDKLFDYYFAELNPSAQTSAYYFEIRQNKRVLFYSRKGIELKTPSNAFQFKIIPDFKTPEWAKGAVLYQIYVDRFYNGNKSNDVTDNEYMYDNWPVVAVKDWNQLPDSTRAYANGSNRTREFYGGDLDGIIQKLDYLQELGIDGIYLNPVFVSPSNHKYDAQDYESIDPHFGVIVKDGGDTIDPAQDANYKNSNFGNSSTVNKEATKYMLRTTAQENLDASNAKMKELIDKAHNKGIKVILDGVFNHAGSFNKWLDREHIYPESAGPGAYEKMNSPFNKYFTFSNNKWPDNESYENWYGFRTLPKLNFEGSEELTNTILNIGAKWAGTAYGIDGWRLDVAADLGHSQSYNHLFWQKFRSSVKSANPNALILAEVYGDSSSWLQGNEWDTVMNYDAFFEPVGWFLTGLEKHSYVFNEKVKNDVMYFDNTLKEKMAKLPYQSLEVAMNELDNHDHSRFLTRTSGLLDGERSNTDVSDPARASEGINKGILKEAVILQMCLPGAPTLYYGNEAGLTGWTDPDCRRAYPWGSEDKELFSFYKDIIKIHKTYSALKTGSYVSLVADNTNVVFAWGRWDQNNKVVAAINNDKSAHTINIPVDQIGLTNGDKISLIFSADSDTHKMQTKNITVTDGSIDITVPAFGGVILAANKGSVEPTAALVKRPVINTLQPAANAKGIAADSVIAVEFSEAMNPRDIIDAFVIEPAAQGTFYWSGGDLTFVPTLPLQPNTKYTVKISSNIAAVSGNIFLKEGKEWSFFTK